MRREGRGYWTSALGLVLEKHGILGLRACTPEKLATSLRADEPLLVGRLLPEAWTEDLMRIVSGAGVPVLLEAPLPRALLALLGVRRSGDVPPDAPLVTTNSELDRAARRYGAPAAGHLAPTAVRPVDRLPELDWRAIPEVPIEEHQAQAWRAPGWNLEAWLVDDDVEVLAEWRPGGAPASPAIVRRGSLMAASYGLFCALAQAHTSEPYDGPEVRTSPRTMGHETLLLAILDSLHDRAGAGSARVLPWPEGITWALNVRHDCDRPLSPRDLRWRLQWHDRLGTRATWYWRAQHLRSGWRDRTMRERLRVRRGSRALREVAADPRHEVAWHTERLWREAEAERLLLETVLGRRLAGSSAHGAPDCFRYQGAPNLIWADAAGLSYTELIQRSHLHPHRCPILREDGRIVALDVICLPHHESLDRSMQPGTANVERLEMMQKLFERTGGLYQVMNHPDLNQLELFELLAAFPREGRLDLTAEEAAHWWRRTHTAENLRGERLGDHAWRIIAAHAVQALQVQLRLPGGSITTRVVDLLPGQPLVVSP